MSMRDNLGTVIRVNDIALAPHMDDWHLVRVTKLNGDGSVEVTASGVSFWNPLCSSIKVVDIAKLPNCLEASR